MLFLLFFLSSAFSEPLKLSIAANVPEKSPIADELKKFGESVNSATKKRVEVRFLFGGIAGTDSKVLESIYKGKLSGAVFSGEILNSIDIALREFERKPKSGAKHPFDLKEIFNKKQFHFLTTFDAGSVYLLSKNKISGVKDIVAKKVWVSPEDKWLKGVLESMKAHPVEVPYPDVRKKADLDVVYGIAPSLISLKWNESFSHLIEEPFLQAFGVLFVREEEWVKIGAKFQKVISDKSRVLAKKLSDLSQLESKSSIKMIKKSAN